MSYGHYKGFKQKRDLQDHSRSLAIMLFDIDLTYVSRTTKCLSVPKMTQIVSVILKRWTVKHSGPVFFRPPCTLFATS